MTKTSPNCHATVLSPVDGRRPDPAAQFVMWALMEGSWQGADIDGGAAQDKAEALGLIAVTAYDPEKHGESDNAEPGDRWYVPSEMLLSALSSRDAATVLSTSQPERMNEVLRLLRKISDLAYDEDIGEPLDCAIDYANKALAALAATPAVGEDRMSLARKLSNALRDKSYWTYDDRALLSLVLIELVRPAQSAQPASPLRGDIRAALFSPETAHARHNLEGALYDIERFRDQGKPTDEVCIRTIKRVIEQLAKAERALTASPPEQPAAALLKEGIEILDNLLARIRKHGNYSAESTITFIDQSLQCFRAAAPKPWIDVGEGDMS